MSSIDNHHGGVGICVGDVKTWHDDACAWLLTDGDHDEAHPTEAGECTNVGKCTVLPPQALRGAATVTARI